MAHLHGMVFAADFDTLTHTCIQAELARFSVDTLKSIPAVLQSIAFAWRCFAPRSGANSVLPCRFLSGQVVFLLPLVF